MIYLFGLETLFRAQSSADLSLPQLLAAIGCYNDQISNSLLSSAWALGRDCFDQMLSLSFFRTVFLIMSLALPPPPTANWGALECAMRVRRAVIVQVGGGGGGGWC